MSDEGLVIEVRALVNRFGPFVVHEGLDLEVRRGEVVGIIGGSGSGKSVLLRSMILLHRPAAGEVRLFGERPEALDSRSLREMRARFGVMFQHGALFSSLTVAENTAFPLRQALGLPEEVLAGLAMLKLSLVGLDASAALKFPPELSGGMLKRAALARALAMDPELLFLDEPSAGLDPVGAGAFDELILELKETLGITVIMISHDLDSLWRVTDRVAFLGEKRILACAPMRELSRDPHPLIAAYFAGPRGRVSADGR